MGPVSRMLPSDEAARRLGVKVSTLYAYVSRGLVVSHPEPGGRRSLFDLSDIERLAHRQRGGPRPETRLATITTGITQLRAGGPFYRGVAAPELARRGTRFEDVAALLWQCAPAGAWPAPELGPCPLTSVADRMRWAVVMCGATDPQRADLRPEALTVAAGRVTAALTDVVRSTDDAGRAPSGGASVGSIGSRLARALVPGAAPSGALTRAVTAALVLMADHELATSTLAVRVAASTRADLYDALAAGLATLAGPLHGGASRQAYQMLVDAEREGAAGAVTEMLRGGRRLPGFGHSIYKDSDPRFDALMAQIGPLLDEERLSLVLGVLELARAHDVPVPNCDLALAALSWGMRMSPDAGRMIFTVARVAGWTAHYMEELTERPLRFRARALYNVEPTASP